MKGTDGVKRELGRFLWRVPARCIGAHASY